MIQGNNSVTQPEVVADNPLYNYGRGFHSGGGFSNVFPAPVYQQSALDNFFSKHNPQYLSYNTTDGLPPNTTLGRYNVSTTFPHSSLMVYLLITK